MPMTYVRLLTNERNQSKNQDKGARPVLTRFAFSPICILRAYNVLTFSEADAHRGVYWST
jgi:hypothetical protein